MIDVSIHINGISLWKILLGLASIVGIVYSAVIIFLNVAFRGWDGLFWFHNWNARKETILTWLWIIGSIVSFYYAFIS